MRSIRLILFLLIGTLFLSACAKEERGEKVDPLPGQSQTESETANRLETDTSQNRIVEGGATKYTLVRPENAADDELEAAKIIYKAFEDNYGIKIPFETDYVKPGEDRDAANPLEICVGKVDRTAAEEAYPRLGDNQFAIGCVADRVTVLGYTPALTKLAAEVLVRDYLNGEDFTIMTGEFMIYEAEPTITYQTFTNPVAPTGDDPWVIRDEDTGKYYYCYSGGNGVCVNEIEDLAHITTEGGRKVYTAPENTMYSAEYWAPELHKIGGKWYIYVAADDGNNDNHRMYVLEGTSGDPTDDFKMVGKITDSTDKWAIDGTVLQYGGECYFVWSGWAGDVNVAQNIYIAHMASPTEIDSERVQLSKPQYRWEKQGGMPTVNEGPAALVKGDTAHIIYSASGSWSDFYNLGKLTFRGGDILDAENWTKSEVSVFEKTDTCFGPGHCSFPTAPDGSTWIVYHANLVAGSGWGGRSVWTQPIEWDGDEPILGAPIGPGVELSLPSVSYSADKVTKK